MKLNQAMFILSKVAGLKVQRMVMLVDEQVIYREMARRWFVWTGSRWISIKRIA